LLVGFDFCQDSLYTCGLLFDISIEFMQEIYCVFPKRDKKLTADTLQLITYRHTGTVNRRARNVRFSFFFFEQKRERANDENQVVLFLLISLAMKVDLKEYGISFTVCSTTKREIIKFLHTNDNSLPECPNGTQIPSDNRVWTG